MKIEVTRVNDVPGYHFMAQFKNNGTLKEQGHELEIYGFGITEKLAKHNLWTEVQNVIELLEFEAEKLKASKL